MERSIFMRDEIDMHSVHPKKHDNLIGDSM